MTIGSGFSSTSGGLLVPTKKRRFTIYFTGGGRTTLECASFDAKVEDGKLVGLEFESESKLVFGKLDAIQFIEELPAV